MGWAAMRERTSVSQAKGSTLARWQEATKLRNPAAVLPPWSLPKNIQLFRPTATLRMARSVALLSISRSPSSQSSGSTPSSSSGCSVPPAPPGSSAVLLPGSPVSRPVTDPGWDGIGAGAAAADPPPPVAALASLPDTTEQSATRLVPCEADPTPTPCENNAGHEPSTRPRSNHVPDL